MSPRFKWESRYSVGNSEIDNQHRYLIELADRLPEQGTDVSARFRELHSFLKEHSNTEEKMMRDMGYPEVAEHIELHQVIQTKLTYFAQNNSISDSRKVIGEWVLGHICLRDMEVFRSFPRTGTPDNSGLISSVVEGNRFSELARSRVLLVEDDPDYADLIEEMVHGCAASFCHASTGAQARKAAENGGFDIALVDIRLPDVDGLDLIAQCREMNIIPSFIVMTGDACEITAERLERLGVETLLTKPFTMNQLKFSLCRELVRKKQAAQVNRSTPAAGDPESALVGISGYIRELRDKIATAAAGRMPVLIIGPTGSGKEVIARTIHALSSRSGKEMVVVNSAAVPEHLEEAEFFGYMRGAFTGAFHAKTGLLKCADNSTLFLDEVADLSLRMQAKLLRVLDGHDFLQLGSTVPIHSDFRLISATNCPIKDLIKTGRFREDLYFRLRAATIITEPLASHPEDIIPLVNHFVMQSNRESGTTFRIASDALESILDYHWPGNVRELKNAVSYLCNLVRNTGLITKRHVVDITLGENEPAGSVIVPFSDAKIGFERNYYTALLVKCGGNISHAARELGLERAWLSKRIKTLGLSRKFFKTVR